MTKAPSPRAGPTGRLKVELESDSWFLKDHLTVEIRDARLQVVKTISGYEGSRGVELPVGLYEVSCVLDDGKVSSDTVQVKADRNPPIKLSAKAQAFAAPAPAAGYERGADALAAQGPSRKARASPRFVEVTGAEMLREEADTWVFGPESDSPDAVPWATFVRGDQAFTLTLPVNPRGHSEEELTCVVTLDPLNDPPFESWIGPGRTVSSAIQRMMHNNHFMQAASVVSQADELLLEKYQDPVGAVLGAHVLYKVGRLRKRRGWVENLARSFEWLPDGKILLAQLLADDLEDLETCFHLIGEASEQTCMFTESFSLMLGMVRRKYPSVDPAVQEKIMDKLMPTLAQINWSSFCQAKQFPAKAMEQENYIAY